jgi:hypothetical protein
MNWDLLNRFIPKYLRFTINNVSKKPLSTNAKAASIFLAWSDLNETKIVYKLLKAKFGIKN